MFLRFILFISLFSIISACSRTNDLVIPAQQVKSDPNCALAPLDDVLVSQLDVSERAKDGAVSRTYLNVRDIGAEELRYVFNLNGASSNLKVELNTRDVGSVLSLSDGSEVLLSDLAMSIKVDGGEAEVIETGVPVLVPLGKSERLVKLSLLAEVEFEENRVDCEFYARKQTTSETDADGNDVELTRFFTSQQVRTEIDIELVRNTSQVQVSIIDSIILGGSVSRMSVANNGSFLIVGLPDDDRGGDSFYSNLSDIPAVPKLGSGSVLVYEWDDLGPQFCGVLKASNSKPGDHFGQRVGISGDWLYVSAPGEDSSFSGVFNGEAAALDKPYDRIDSGAVYRFRSTEGCEFSEDAYIKNPDNVESYGNLPSHFGAALSVGGGEFVVGAPRQTFVSGNTLTKGVGAVYHYILSDDGAIGPAKKHTPVVVHENSAFGSSIDFNARFMLVGAPKEGVDASSIEVSTVLFNGAADASVISALEPAMSAFGSGAALLFNRPEKQTQFQVSTYLKPASSDLGQRINDEGDQFGFSVSVVENSVFVGAPYEDSPSSLIGFGADKNAGPANQTTLDGDYGAVYRYDVNAFGGANLIGYIKSRKPVQGAKFGAVIAVEERYLAVANPGIVGDFNGFAASKGHVEVIDHTTYDDPIFVSVFEDELTDSALSANVEAMDLYGGTLVLGLPKATINGVNESGAFAIW